MKFLITVMALLVGGFASANPAWGQHHHHGGHQPVHAPIHSGIHFGHSTWHHVVPHIPHHRTHVGAYYTVGHTHYYTPSPVVPLIAPQDLPVAPAPVVVEAQKPVEIAFGGYSRYEDLAGRLAFEANALCLDLHYNYRQNKNFAEVYREVYDVLQAARYLSGREHNGDRATINKRMVEVDKLFHHVQDEMKNWTRVAAKQVGPNGLPEKIEGVEAVIHHLCFDTGVKPHEQAAPAPGTVDPTEVAPPPPVIK